MVCWEVGLSKGQEWDWFGDPFWRMQTLTGLFIFGLIGLVVWESRHARPVVNFRPLRERNFAMSCIIIFCAFGVLYGTSTTLPGMLQTLFGYDAFHAGLVMSPAGFFSIIMMVVVGALIGRQVDARKLIATGLLTLAAANYWMSRMNLDISPWQVVWPRVLTIVGLSMIFAPLNVAAYLYTPQSLRPAAIGLLALLRNEGGSVGTTIAQTFQERREQFHLLRLNEFLDPLNPAISTFLQQAKNAFFHLSGDPAGSQKMALQALENLRTQQASALAYFDCFWLFSALGAGLVVLVFIMKRSVAEKGAHVASE
jgi:DHA2 family multidrug resistance protein